MLGSRTAPASWSQPGLVKAVLVMLHGSGDSGQNLRETLSTIAGGHFLRQMHERGVEVLLPTAARRPYRLQPGVRLNVWFDRYAMEPTAQEDTPSIDQSAALLAELLNEVHQTRGIPANKVVVGGFSMGGGMALHLAMREADRGLAGVFALSSYICTDSPALALDSAKRLPPVFMRHGAADGFILPSWGEQTAAQLVALGNRVDFQRVPGLQHDLSDGEVVELTQWVLDRLQL